MPHRLELFSIPVRYFLEVATAGSVSAAARSLHIAASAVSRQVGKLEDALGLALFERRSSGMVLTEAGTALLTHARASHGDFAQLARSLQGQADAVARRTRLGCTDGFAAGLIPTVLETFRREAPDAQVELHVLAPAEIGQRLRQGELDLGLHYSIAPAAGLAVLHARREPLHALMRPGHPLAGAARIGVLDAVRHPLALGPAGLTGRTLFDLACAAQQLQYRTAFVSNASEVLLGQLGPGDIAVGGFHTAMHRVAAGTLVAVPFSDTTLRQRMLQLVAAEGRALPPLARRLAELLVQQIGEDAGRQRSLKTGTERRRRRA